MRAKLIRSTEPHATPRSAILISGFFLVAGIALVIALLLLPLYRSLMARSWRQVPCTILSSGVESKNAMQASTTYQIAITYSYVVNGREYTGHRYDFFPVATSGYHSKADVVRQYVPGTQRHCLVNPADPAQAVLTRHLGARVWIGLLPLTFVLGGGLVMIQAVRQARGRSTEKGGIMQAGLEKR
jgi:hypothetical protein